MSKRNQLSPMYLLALMLSMFFSLAGSMAHAKDLPDFADLVDKYGGAVVNVSTKARQAAGRLQAKTDLANAVLILQARCKVGQSLQKCEAVHLDP